MKNLLKYGTMVIAIVFVLISCDTDPTELGGEFLGIDVDNTIIEEDFEVTAYSARLNPVQTNNFGSVQLGTYNDPIYGKTTYDFVTQLGINSAGISFGENRRVDSVILTIPYFSRSTGQTGEATTYQLDSVYGNEPINFKIFRNNYFLNSFDPENVEQAATYFSDLGPTVNDIKGEAIEFIDLENPSNPAFEEVTNFTPSPEEVLLTAQNSDNETVVSSRLSPRFRLALEPNFWKDLIVDNENAEYLDSDSNFRNFFRGLYFQVTSSTGNGNLSYLNLTDATIQIFYTSDIPDVQENLASSFILNLTGGRAVMLNNELPSGIQDQISDSFNPENGSERLYLKGGPGAISLIDLFGPDLIGGSDGGPDGVPDQLASLRRNDILVNEANLEFYVDQTAFANATSVSVEPENILLYNLSNRSIIGFGTLQRNDSSGPGIKYEVSLTQYISDILSGTIEIGQLGICVTQNLSAVGASRVKNQTQPQLIESIPIGSAISHEGTVLHGNLSSDPEKRLKLKIFYTEIN
ncbi:DUF4270 domain-containing protein [Nonlabens agnitus]|uniref:DUF4270 domain-containing protein n=1 Tax=Nonlabens agnitus TaxID=870484 RepID=A0A2S9WW23_9FLAO|nr:DUF4270 domain-containing protein [Nonlabens agnitus]PRP67654.1 hypothetical protein BST86_11415 [Nonlabens agnitus]